MRKKISSKPINDEAEALLIHERLIDKYAETFEKLADRPDFESAMNECLDKNKELYRRLGKN